MSWSLAPIIGLIVGVLIMVFGFRKREQKPFVFEDIDGVLKQDWTRTGNIDFHIGTPDSASPHASKPERQERREGTPSGA